MTAADLRYGRRGGRWLPKPAARPATPWTEGEVMAAAKAILSIIAVFPGCRVLRTTAAVRDRTLLLAKMQGAA